MRVNLAGVELKNPVVVASGTFGFGREFAEYFPLENLGGICVKGLTVSKVAASAKTALDGEWPIARELYIFTNGDPKGGVKKLVDYLLAADKGQKDVLAVGYVPLQH